VDAVSSAQPGHPEIRIELDRQRAASLGVTPAEVGKALRLKILGNLIGTFREGEERIGIRLRASESSRKRIRDVGDLRIRLAKGEAVPVSSLALIRLERGPAAIDRFGGSRTAEVTAKVASMDLGKALKGVKEALGGLDLPPGVQMELAGKDRDLQTSFRSLRLMLALAVFLVYVVMAAQFESLLHPLIILMAVPMGIVGVVAALWMCGTTISVLVLIGVVMLAGIVVNNAIVLVDAINRRRREGQPLEAAIIQGGHERLRPILMTTTTTVLALLPMALGLGAGDELRAPLAITVIGGLSLATVLTLVVVPCMYRALSAAGGEDVELSQSAGDAFPIGRLDPEHS
ncbi:MAG: efflux RND transporter permease subunit, partial [Acidobacteriota bacterium]